MNMHLVRQALQKKFLKQHSFNIMRQDTRRETTCILPQYVCSNAQTYQYQIKIQKQQINVDNSRWMMYLSCLFEIERPKQIQALRHEWSCRFNSGPTPIPFPPMFCAIVR